MIGKWYHAWYTKHAAYNGYRYKCWFWIAHSVLFQVVSGWYKCSVGGKNLLYMGVSKNRGKTPKMEGENNGKPYEQIDNLGVPLFLETPIWFPSKLLQPIPPNWGESSSRKTSKGSRNKGSSTSLGKWLRHNMATLRYPAKSYTFSGLHVKFH